MTPRSFIAICRDCVERLAATEAEETIGNISQHCELCGEFCPDLTICYGYDDD